MIQFRSGAQGYGYDLQDKLKKILYDNGMNANIRQDASGNNYLVVRTADMVAEKSYKLNHEQLNQLTALGGGPLIEKAYNPISRYCYEKTLVYHQHLQTHNPQGYVML